MGIKTDKESRFIKQEHRSSKDATTDMAHNTTIIKTTGADENQGC